MEKDTDTEGGECFVMEKHIKGRSPCDGGRDWICVAVSQNMPDSGDHHWKARKGSMPLSVSWLWTSTFHNCKEKRNQLFQAI